MTNKLDELFKNAQPAQHEQPNPKNFVLRRGGVKKLQHDVVTSDEEEISESERKISDSHPAEEESFEKEQSESDKKEASEDAMNQKDSEIEMEKLKRTLFVGNVPVSCIERKSLLKERFSKHGNIESIRFRSIAFSQPISKKAAFIQKMLKEERESVNAYIVFKQFDSIQSALSENATVFEGNHIRVDSALNPFKPDNSKSIFIGNLPLKINEESVWTFFQNCGSIFSVRLIRDKASSMGKGFGYVQFDKKSSATLALKLNGSEFQGREIRIFKCDKKEKESRRTKRSAAFRSRGNKKMKSKKKESVKKQIKIKSSTKK